MIRLPLLQMAEFTALDPMVVTGSVNGTMPYWERGHPSRPDPEGGMPALPVIPYLLRANDIFRPLVAGHKQ